MTTKKQAEKVSHEMVMFILRTLIATKKNTYLDLVEKKNKLDKAFQDRFEEHEKKIIAAVGQDMFDQLYKSNIASNGEDGSITETHLSLDVAHFDDKRARYVYRNGSLFGGLSIGYDAENPYRKLPKDVITCVKQEFPLVHTPIKTHIAAKNDSMVSKHETVDGIKIGDFFNEVYQFKRWLFDMVDCVCELMDLIEHGLTVDELTSAYPAFKQLLSGFGGRHAE